MPLQATTFAKCLSVLSLSVASLQAQVLVRDINPSVIPGVASIPQWPCVVGNQLFFSADDGSHGRELWRTDGTTAGTQMFVDLVPGSAGSDPRSITAFAGGLAFVASNTMYLSNGISGVRPLGPALPGFDGLRGAPTVFGSRLYYAGSEPAFGSELWSTDGTHAGTARLVDLAPGTASAEPDSFAIASGLLFFSARNGAGARRLYRCDGTAAGTFDVAPAASYGQITRIVSAGSFVVFASHVTKELWRSDGTAAGTSLLRSGFTAGPVHMAAVGSRVVFSAADAASGYEPWLTDGTVAGTQLMADVRPGSGGSLSTEGFTVFGKRVVFPASDGVWGNEPWISDLTPAGTVLLRDIAPNAASSLPTNCRVAGGALWFMANEGTVGGELWRSDGTAAGTQLVADVQTGGNSSFPSEFTALGSEVFFAADHSPLGREAWITDGTAAGTRLLADIGSPATGSNPVVIGRLGRRTLLLADDGVHGREPWITDGTAAGTVLLADLVPGSQGSSVVRVGEWRGRFWFRTTVGGVLTLFASDGTTAGTAPFRTFPGSDSLTMVPFGDRALLLLSAGFAPPTTWITNGTLAGTQPFPLPAPIAPTLGFAALGDQLYFAATDAANGTELWRTNGTLAGTALFADLTPGPSSSNFYGLTVVGERLYFSAGLQVATPFQASDHEPWVTDGTTAGTMRVADINPGAGSSSPQVFVPFLGRTWFVANPGTGFTFLVSTNGTAAGTTLAVPLAGNVAELVVAGDRLFFPFNGELWSSDGTRTGTALAVDLTPGSGPVSGVTSLVPLGASGKLVFAATLPGEAQSLWLTDGTMAGTRRLGAGFSGFSLATRSGSDVFFTATDPASGSELWALRLRDENAAMADVVGPGCSGATGTPRIRADTGPLLGTTFPIQLDGAPPSRAALLGIASGLTPTGDRSPCLVGLDPVSTITLAARTDAAGHASMDVQVPPATWLLGLEFWSQWIVLDPPGGYRNRYSLSPVLDWLVGI